MTGATRVHERRIREENAETLFRKIRRDSLHPASAVSGFESRRGLQENPCTPQPTASSFFGVCFFSSSSDAAATPVTPNVLWSIFKNSAGKFTCPQRYYCSIPNTCPLGHFEAIFLNECTGRTFFEPFFFQFMHKHNTIHFFSPCTTSLRWSHLKY